jgi:signal transduction histidine kinase
MNSIIPSTGVGFIIGEQEDHSTRFHRELVTALSHDLRTLLSNISSVAGLLKEETPGAADDSKQEYLDILIGQSQRISNFLDKVLDLHRLETCRFSFQMRPLPVALLVEAAVRQWQLPTADHGFHVKLPARPPWAWGDENTFQSILNNLLDNAVKYTPPGTGIEVEVERFPGEVVVSVRDGGPGIPAADQDQIFDGFYRNATGSAQPVYGHGLGLFISKRLVEAMGGRLWLESAAGRGCCFRFTLPDGEGNHG